MTNCVTYSSNCAQWARLKIILSMILMPILQNYFPKNLTKHKIIGILIRSIKKLPQIMMIDLHSKLFLLVIYIWTIIIYKVQIQIVGCQLVAKLMMVRHHLMRANKQECMAILIVTPRRSHLRLC
jgi:hypothetical protein